MVNSLLIKSFLLRTVIRGLSSIPNWRRTSMTALNSSSTLGAARLTTCRRRSAWEVSSRVARKASTNWWGSLLIKPTVSTRKTSCRLGRTTRRRAGSRVAKSRSETSTSVPVIARKSVDFPALVYPTKANTGQAFFSLGARCKWRWARTFFNLLLTTAILRRSLRRSVSSFVSPGPRVPIPPPRRERISPFPERRGRRYSNWAFSTWSLASLVCARWAKMSRIKPVRSTILVSRTSSKFPAWAGVSSSSKITRSARCTRTNCRNSSILPGPRKKAGSGRWLRRERPAPPTPPAETANSLISSSAAPAISSRPSPAVTTRTAVSPCPVSLAINLFLLGVKVINESQSFQGQNGVYNLDHLRLLSYYPAIAAGGHHLRLPGAHLPNHAADQPVHQIRITVDQPRLDTGYGVFPDHLRRLFQFHPGELGGIMKKGLCGDPNSGDDYSPQVFRFRVDGAECCRSTEINNDHRCSVKAYRRHGIGHPVRSYLPGVFITDGEAGTNPRSHYQRFTVEIYPGHFDHGRGERRDNTGQDHRFDLPGGKTSVGQEIH